MQWVEYLAGVSQAAVGLCFGYAALAKLVWFRDFERAVGGFKIVPFPLIRAASMIVVAVEASVAFSFLCGYGLPWAAATALVALAVFGLVVGFARRRGVVTACMCFGPNGPDSTSPETLVRIALLGAGVSFALVRTVRELPDGHAPVATIVAGGCVLVGCTAVLDLSALARLAHGSGDARRDVHG